MAQSAPTGFQSPSKNIACQYFGYDKQNVLRCDISAMETKPRRPADCELDYGGAFEMNAKGPAARICHGDTVMDKALPVLGYGEVWQRGGFTCTSEQRTRSGAGSRWHGRSRKCFEEQRSTAPQAHHLVILREGGVSSTPRRPGLIATALEYWIPAFAGMTAEGEDA
jgi:hypothetical protein